MSLSGNYKMSEEILSPNNLNAKPNDGSLATASNTQLVEKLRSMQNKGSVKQVQIKRRFLTFRLGEQWFALGANNVQEISRLGTVTRVPLVREHVLGVVNLRGNITAVIDVRNMLNLPRPVFTNSSRVVVLKSDGLEAGIVAETVSEVIEVNRESIEPPLVTIERELSKFYEGTFQLEDKTFIILNPSAILMIGKPL